MSIAQGGGEGKRKGEGGRGQGDYDGEEREEFPGFGGSEEVGGRAGGYGDGLSDTVAHPTQIEISPLLTTTVEGKPPEYHHYTRPPKATLHPIHPRQPRRRPPKNG